MAKKNNRNPFAFTPTILDQDSHEKRRVIKQLPSVHQTETLQKFFGASADHLFDPGKGKAINGYVGQKPLWYDPDQDYYLEEGSSERSFYQLEASMVSRSTEGDLTDLLPYNDLINQLRFQGALVNNHNRLFSQDYYTWCPPVDLDKIVNFRQYVWLPIDDVEPTSTFEDGPNGWVLSDGSDAPVDGPYNGLNKFLGRFAGTTSGDQIVSKTFDLNGNLTSADIQFDFIKLDSWDANSANAGSNERIVVWINDNRAFEYIPVGINAEGGNSIGSGTFVVDDIVGTYNVTSPGVDSYLGGNSTWTDRVYRVSVSLEGTGETLKLGFGSTTNQVLDDESLGIDNVRVSQNSNSSATITVYGPTYTKVSNGLDLVYDLPGYGSTDSNLADFYDLSLLDDSLIVVLVDGVNYPFTYVPGQQTISFTTRPPADAEVQISVYSDLENNAIGLAYADTKAFGGIQLSSGMRINVKLDKSTDYTNGDVWIVENVGRKIILLKEGLDGTSEADYMVIARGAANRNEWSLNNRWFHVSTLSDNLDSDYIQSRRATRPIIEFNSDVALYNYGSTRRLDVDILVEDLEDINGYLNQSPQDVTIDGVRIRTQGTNQITVDAVNPDTGIVYGDVESIRLLIRNTINPLLNNNIFVIVNQGNVLKLILETDGLNPSGTPEFGEAVRVRLGNYQGRNLHWDGSSWVVSQKKTSVNQAPLFELYDLNGTMLRDSYTYPNSSFKGSKLFSYKVDTTGSRIADKVLGIPLIHDNKGQILFENYLNTEKFSYIVGGKPVQINGFYFHNDAGQLCNDWYKSASKTRQFMVDRYVSDGRTKLFNVSQDSEVIEVSRGRVNDSKSFERAILVEDKDFIRVGRQVMIINIQRGDIIEIRTYNPENPPEDATGHYEVPMNLQANPDNELVTDLTKGDFYDHFSEIMKNQTGFSGAEYAANNWRDTARDMTLGTHIIQNSASLLKTMLLASQSQLDITSAIRYSDGEYSRFKDKFQQKVLSYVKTSRFTTTTSYDVWINTALEDLNKGKTKHFAFYLSGMAKLDGSNLPTFIPATPSYLGVYPIYTPTIQSEMIQTTDGITSVWYLRGHDGSIVQIEDETVATVCLALEERIFNSIPASIRNRERPLVDFDAVHGDQYRNNEYTYDEWLKILRPSFERWAVVYGQDYTINDRVDSNDPWTWNWSSLGVPGHWRGIYQKFYGTQRPDLTPWESLGFTIKPLWWDSRYGSAPYTSENLILWDDLEAGYIHEGDRQGINKVWARPGLSNNIPVDPRGRLRHPGPRNLASDGNFPGVLTTNGVIDESKCELYEYDTATYYSFWTSETYYLKNQTVKFQSEDSEEIVWLRALESHTSDMIIDELLWQVIEEPVLGCGICEVKPLPTDLRSDWKFGDLGPIEQIWRRSSTFAFAAANSGYLMKPAAFVDLGWNTRDIDVFFKGTRSEQILNNDTNGRPRHSELQVHGEELEDLTLVEKVGIQQWISDLLASKNTSINTNLAEKVRGLTSQLSYKVAGFTDSSTLVVVSDAFSRIPSEDVTVSLYRSPSVREETYSGVALEWTGRGYEIYGYDALNPMFTIIPGNEYGPKVGVGLGATAASIPSWKASTYYSVNITVKEGENFYRALKTHTSSSFFEPEYWTQVARPQYADGTRLVWALEPEFQAVPETVPYGTVLKTPQEVANFLNGYQRYLESKGWIFDTVNDDNLVKDWKTALSNFIIWSSKEELSVGDFIALSPSSNLVKFRTDTGTIQPIEQIVNGLYAIVDQYGQPIDHQKTRVVRNDGDISVTCDLTDGGIFGLRLYVSELEHILVFNNNTIFGDTIYNPLLNIKQPRLRVQGFKTVGWKGRIDAPGFIVTGDTLTPNFERAADDFRRFFETESMENKKLQDRARANFGYEEKEYLNNLLLTPTNQFEFYQGMIQQKGSPTSMRRLLRSNFVRHNKGLGLFEEWAFRVGSYGGQEVSPSLDIQIKQSEFKHNPQLITFEQAPTGTTVSNTYGVVNVTDFTNNGILESFDSRWHWRPEMNSISWPVKEYGKDELPTAGFVNLDEVRFTVLNNTEFASLYGDQLDLEEPINNGDRVWVYGIGLTNSDGSPNFDGWQTYKFNDTLFDVIDIKLQSHDLQGAVVVLDKNVNGFVDMNSDPDGFFLSQNIKSNFSDTNGFVISDERLVFKNLNTETLQARQTYTPRFRGKASITIDSNSNAYNAIMDMAPEAGQYIRSITVTVDEAFEDGSQLTVGHDMDVDFFIAAREEEVRDIYPTNYDSDTVLVQTPSVSYIPDLVDTAEVELIRVGKSLDICGETVVEYEWVRASDGASVVSTVTFPRPSDYNPGQDADANYLQTISLPLLDSSVANGSEGTLIVKTNGEETDRQYMTFVRTQSAGVNTVDLTRATVYNFSSDMFSTYPYDTALAVNAQTISAQLMNTGNKGKLTIDIDYAYSRGFELVQFDDLNQVVPVAINEEGTTADICTWVKTRYADFASIPQVDGLWKNGDIVEVDNLNGLWAVYKYQNGWSEGLPYRIQNRKVNSDLVTSAAIFNTVENKLKLVLQLYDPAKGYIPGVADRELDFKMVTDPAKYNENQYVWGEEQVGQLWWDQSTTRYLDYEIEDDINHGVNYRWKNWGRVAPGAAIDIYEWVRSPVVPASWNDYVDSKANLQIDNKPSGVIVSASDVQYVTSEEWNDATQSDEIVYYFWVKNPTITPLRPGRKLSAQQVSNIITNPSANDIPFFAVIGKNQVIVGGIKQFLNETDTVLKVKWNLEAGIHNNHHKQWIILREADERNTIHDTLWNKMRDSLVGWDATQLAVPDARLPKAQQVGSLVRPRQSWFPAQQSPNGGQRPNRAAREAFVDTMNEVFAAQPFVDIWYNMNDVFDTGEAAPDETQYVTTALDLDELKALLPASRNMVQIDECVLIPATEAVAGFWTLWRLVEIAGQRTFILEDFQKWRMQEGELWNLADWYDENWSAKNFPNYRFATTAARDAAGNLDVTLLKGTLVQIDHTDGDGRWTWDVYTNTTKYQVAKNKATMKLSDAFFDDTRTEFGPVQVAAVLETAIDQRITPDRIQELADMINYRDGSRELEFMINSMRTELLDTLQKNTVFFNTVKSAFHQSNNIDWAFKTSFLYLGGYSETLRQSPVAFKDQIDNVIAYLEDVKPYHVKIREYVRRLSYGPDIANLAMTDFDKPVYPDGSNNRILNVNNIQDQSIMAANRPWKDWYNNYQNEVKDSSEWDLNWNGVRKTKVTIKYDRVSCGTIRGWDTHPWDPSMISYDQRGGQTRSLSQLSEMYRSGTTDGSPNYYRDQTAENIEERNYLVRKGIVTADRPGTIVTVLDTKRNYMWSGIDWIEFKSLGWDQDPDMGMASRMDSYRPQPGMIRADDPNVIEGCGFDGTIISSQFRDAAWDIFEWDGTLWSDEVSVRAGSDIDVIDGNTTPEDENDPANIRVTGNEFSQPAVNGDRPRELVFIRSAESLVINVKRDENLIQKSFMNQKGNWMTTAVSANTLSFVEYIKSARELVIQGALALEDDQGFTPLHNPQRPSTGFLRDVAISKGYRSNSEVDMTYRGMKTFKLRDSDALEGLPLNLVGDSVKVAIVNANNPEKRAIGELVPSNKGNELASWNGTLEINVFDDWVDLGSGSSWNIIPLDAYNVPGVVWIGNVRITYTGMELRDNLWYLTGALIDASSLNGLDIGEDASVTIPNGAVIDGSLQRTINQ